MINGKQAAAIALTLIIAVPILAGYAFASETTTKAQYVVEDSFSISDTLLNGHAYYYSEYSGPANNNLLMNLDTVTYTNPDYLSQGSVETSIPIGSTATASFTLDANDYVSLSSFAYSNYKFSTSDETWLKLTYSDSTTEDLYYAYGCDFIKAASTVILKEPGYAPSEAYELVSDVSIKVANTASLSITYYDPNGTTYGDPSYGWTLPDVDDTYSWFNGYSNASVTFYLWLQTPDSGTYTVGFGPHIGTYAGATDIHLSINSSGIVTVTDYQSNSYTLGQYTNVQIAYDQANRTCTVTGIADWPTMGGTPAKFNSVSFDVAEVDGDGDTFNMITLTSTTASSAIWRCDSARIIAGTFPATVDYTLSLDGKYPDREYNLKFNSIGLYGRSISVWNFNFPVTDNTITVNGETINLKGAVFAVRDQGDYWTCEINGVDVSGSTHYAAAPTITFNGTWWLTATVDLITTETVVADEWKAGAFAFDKDSFILMMIFTAAAVFVALGFTAGRSDGKVLLLAIACGGASVIALILV